MMFCITPQRLQQEFTNAIACSRDIAAVLDPETYRSLTGEGVYLDYYGIPSEPDQVQQAPRTINIEPTPDGYRAMKRLYQDSIVTYQQKLQHLDLLLTNVEATRFGEATGDVHSLLTAMVDEKRATIEDESGFNEIC
jgi:hypothetical protein